MQKLRLVPAAEPVQAQGRALELEQAPVMALGEQKRERARQAFRREQQTAEQQSALAPAHLVRAPELAGAVRSAREPVRSPREPVRSPREPAGTAPDLQVLEQPPCPAGKNPRNR